MLKQMANHWSSLLGGECLFTRWQIGRWQTVLTPDGQILQRWVDECCILPRQEEQELMVKLWSTPSAWYHNPLIKMFQIF